MRNRLRAGDRPRRLFEDVNTVARSAGLLRGRRVLDSTPLLDAVAPQDTVTQLRAAIRMVLSAAEQVGELGLAAVVRAALTRDDDYATVGKPPCDWDDQAARDALVDALVRDADAALAVLEGRGLTGALGEAAHVLALVAGQDVEPGADGMFRIARKVARDRVISTVDTRARHGHKSRARTFDWYRAYLAVDPDDELITNVAVTPPVPPTATSSTTCSRPRSGERPRQRQRRGGDDSDRGDDGDEGDGGDDGDGGGRAAAAPRTSSSSTRTPARQPARRGTPRRSVRGAAAVGRPASHRDAPTARCVPRAPRHGRVG